MEQEKRSVDVKDLLVVIGDKEMQLYYLRTQIAELEKKMAPPVVEAKLEA